MSDDNTKGGPPALVYKGEVIHERQEMLSLTDMWKASGSPDARRPADWLALASTIEFRAAVEASFNAGKSGIIGERGRGKGTWAHWQIAMAYAKYLDHDFHMWCNEVVRERMEGRPVAIAAVNDLGPDARKALGGIVKSVVPGLLAEAMQDAVPALRALVASILDEKRATPALDFAETVSAHQVIEMAGVAPGDRQRGTAQMVTSRLLAFCAKRQVACLRTPAVLNPSEPYRFPYAIVCEWLMGTTCGLQLIRNQIERAKARKNRNSGSRQTILQFVPPA